jgi:CDP-glycerol glycerophosphotransferase (TagB/SpsB family)
MKAILFCNLPYAFGIYEPLADELKRRGLEYIWYIPQEILSDFKQKNEPYTSSLKDIENFKSDAIFVCGNEVPYWLRGVKVQIFHGLAGEKKGHFRIRDYFDLYLTQGPYFTDKFKELKEKHKNFEVVETGWCKLDKLFNYENQIKSIPTILYAPTFSPSLTSAKVLFNTIKELDKEYRVIVKFHDKMDREIVELYKDSKLEISGIDDITSLLQISDILISDTSSVVYEFLLLDKPVVTLNSKSNNIKWEDTKDIKTLKSKVIEILDGSDEFKQKRKEIISKYHPYNDGKSSYRVIEAVLEYIDRYGIPNKRDISLFRKYKIMKKFKMIRW